jgi:Outer membrane protein beta-barrel domain
MNDQTDMNRGFLKDKLGNYQVNPPEKVWNEISFQTQGRRSRKGLIIILLASAASFALLVTLGIHFFGPDLPQKEGYVEEITVPEDLSSGSEEALVKQREALKLEQKVVETLATLPDLQASEHGDVKVAADRSRGSRQSAKNQENGSSEAPLSLAMQSIRMAEESEAIELQDLLLEQDVDPEQNAQSGQKEVVDPPLKLLEEELGNLADDPELIQETGKKRNPRWMLGAALSPLYSFRDADAAAIPSGPSETGLLSYSTGIHVSYRRNSRLAFETGIYFNKTGIAIGAPGIQVFNQKYDGMLFSSGSEQADIRAVSNSVGNIIAYSGDIYMNGYKINAEHSQDFEPSASMNNVEPSDQGIQQHLDYLELPFNLRYSIVDRSIELQVVGGMSANFLVNNYVTMEGSSGQEEIGYLSNVNTVNYSGNAGLGMIYHLGDKLSLNLEPRFRYFINSVNDSTLPSTRPYSFGFYTGLSYTF